LKHQPTLTAFNTLISFNCGFRHEIRSVQWFCLDIPKKRHLKKSRAMAETCGILQKIEKNNA